MEYGPIIAAIAAVITGAFGGVLRDMLCNTIPSSSKKRSMRVSHLAPLGSTWDYCFYTPLPKDVVIIITLVAGLTARLLAIRYKLGLPVFNYENQD